MTDEKIMTRKEFEGRFRMYFKNCHGTTFVVKYSNGGYSLSLKLDNGELLPLNQICNAGKNLATVIFMMNRKNAEFDEMEIRIE